MARPRATEEQRHEQRARLRRAAAEIHAELGLGGVTARAVASRAGVSTGTLYSYFDGLPELMRSLWTEPVATANEQLVIDIEPITDPVERIRFLLGFYARFAAEHPEVHRSAMLYVRPVGADRAPVQPAVELPFYRLLHDAITEAQAGGAVRAGDVDEMTQVLWAGIHGALALPVNIEAFDIDDADVLAPAMIDTLLRSITT